MITEGALVEKEIPSTIVSDHSVELLLREPDFTSASRLAAAINENLRAVRRRWIRPPCECTCRGSRKFARRFYSQIEAVEVTADQAARIVINERTGTIVATSHIKIASCAVSHGNLTISIASSLDVSQPSAFSQTGTTQVTPRTDTKVKEEKGH